MRPTSRPETGAQYISWSQGRSTSRSLLQRSWQSAGAFFLSSLSTSPPTLYITPEQSVVSSYLLYLLPLEFCPWHNQKNEVCNPQSTGQHEEVLWLSKNSDSSIQTWQQSLPGRIGHPDYVLFAETLASMAWPLCSGKTDRTYGLSLKLPHQMKQLHPVFNVVKLTPVPDDMITGQKVEDHCKGTTLRSLR